MATISRKSAEEIAYRVTTKLRNKIADLEKTFRLTLEKMYKESIPKEIMEFFLKYKDYTRTTSSYYLQGNGFTGKTFSFPNSSLPEKTGYTKWIPSKEQYETLHKIDYELQDLKIKLENSKTEIVNSILALGTTKRVIENLPDLIPYLTIRTPVVRIKNTQLMINIDAITSKIKCLLSEDMKECLPNL